MRFPCRFSIQSTSSLFVRNSSISREADIHTQKPAQLNEAVEKASYSEGLRAFSKSPEQAKVILPLAAAIATVSIVGVGLSLTMTLLSIRLGQQGYSAHAIGLNPAAGGVATLLSAPFVPSWARQVGMRPMLFLSLLVSAICLWAFTFSDNYWSWLILRAVFGVSLTALFVFSEYWINSVAPPARRGFILGLYATSLAMGYVTGPALLSLMGTAGSLPFYGGVGLFALATLPILVGSSKAPEIESPSQIAPFGFLAAAPIAMLASFLHGGIETASMSLLPVYGLFSGLTPEGGVSLVSVFALGNVLAQVPIGFLSDRFDRLKLLMGIALFGLIGSLILPTLGPSHFYVFAALLAVWGGVVGSLYAVGLAYLGSRYSGPELASVNAAFIMLYSLGMLAGPPIMGVGMDIWTPDGFFFAAAAMLGAYCTLIGWKQVKARV
jgi:MFS family permease